MRRKRKPSQIFREFAEECYLPFAEVQKETWRTDDTLLRLHILPFVGSMKMQRITQRHVIDLIAEMRSKGYASGTIGRVLAVFRRVINLARNWQVIAISSNPVTGLNAGPEVTRMRTLNEAEMGRLLLSISEDENNNAACAILLLLLTGARRNEITQARWEWVDWERRTLLVPKSKTGAPRLVILSQAAISILAHVRQVSIGSDYIFPSGVTGQPPASLFFPWNRIRQRAGLSDVRLHDLRHSFASFMVNRGVSLYIVQRLLGHKHPRATQRYAHLAIEKLHEAVEVLPCSVSFTDVGFGLAHTPASDRRLLPRTATQPRT